MQSGSFPQVAAHTTLLQQLSVGLLLVPNSDGLRVGQLWTRLVCPPALSGPVWEQVCVIGPACVIGPEVVG